VTLRAQGDLSTLDAGWFHRFRSAVLDIAAPGSDVRSSCNCGDSCYCEMSGTSMAAPHVAGVVALILSAEPTSTIEEIADRLYLGATQSVRRRTLKLF